jgi:hypothetical protein
MKWIESRFKTYFMEADDGEIIDEVAGDYSNNTYKVVSLDKRYTSLKAAQKAAEDNFTIGQIKATKKDKNG